MEQKGYASLDDFRGKLNNRILTLEEVDRTHRFKWEINPDRCKSCGLCQDVCIYDAVVKHNGKFKITKECDGCGLCEQVCSAKAISPVLIGG